MNGTGCRQRKTAYTEAYTAHFSRINHQRPDGPSTELQADSYAKAAVMRARRVADIALALMGVTQAAGWWEVERAQFLFGETSAKGIVDRVLEELSADARNSGTKP